MNQVLLIIDAQQALIEGSATEKPVYNKEQLIQNINQAIAKAQDAHVPIVFVRDIDIANGTGTGFQIHSEIQVPEEAPIFDKQATNAFHGTGLLPYLNQLEIAHIVIMGCATQYCIDTAVRAATVNGFDVTLVADGHSTTDSPVLSAELIIKHHNKTLHGFSNVEHFSIVRPTEEDIFSPLHDYYREQG